MQQKKMLYEYLHDLPCQWLMAWRLLDIHHLGIVARRYADGGKDAWHQKVENGQPLGKIY